MKSYTTDYETYTQIKWDLHRPIHESSWDFESHKRLYESKLSYLERLRVRCFSAINSKEEDDQSPSFQMQDYENILQAIRTTRAQLAAIVASHCVNPVRRPHFL